MRTPSIHQKTCQRLTRARDDEKDSHQCPDLCIGKRIFLHEPGEQRRQHEVKKMRSTVCKPAQRNYRRVPLRDTRNGNSRHPGILSRHVKPRVDAFEKISTFCCETDRGCFSKLLLERSGLLDFSWQASCKLPVDPQSVCG